MSSSHTRNVCSLTLVFFIAGVFFSNTLNAATTQATNPANYIPPVLEPWKGWVMYDHKEVNCPHAYNSESQRFCRWPVSLALDIQAEKASFQQAWQLFSDGWLTLPGDDQHWPTNITLSQSGDAVTSFAVVRRNDAPSIFVAAGQYRVKGEILWVLRPESLAVPNQTAVFSLVVDGNKVNSVNLDKQGRLWFANGKTRAPSDRQNDSVTTRVYRKIIDGVPVTIETRLEMEVAGASRELVLGQMQLDGYETLRFDSDLPARIEKEGSLRVQVKPGRWFFTLLSRQVEEVAAIKSVNNGEDWPEQEIWVFQADRQFRTVKVTGVPAIDPEQTGLPNHWKQLPAYVVTDGQTLVLQEQIRGDQNPDSNQLSLTRKLWLDFDGQGYTVKDEMRGSIRRIGRLSSDQHYGLGRVSVNGNPYVVTTMDDGRDGIEVRPGSLALNAVGRLSTESSTLAAVGWSEPMESLSIDLQLPPGWTLFTATGADSVGNSWVSSWSLWHVFIFLITVVTCYRLFGVKWALLAAVALLAVHEVQGAPWSFVWLLLLALYGLLSVIPEGRWKKITSSAYRSLMLGLAISLLPFAVNQLRQGLYPQLEKPTTQAQRPGHQVGGGNETNRLEYDAREDLNQVRELGLSASAPRMGKPAMTREKTLLAYQRYDVNTKIQTGPGVPQWRWNQSRLRWSGPVTEGQTVTLWFINPTANVFLAFARVVLMGLLLMLFMKQLGRTSNQQVTASSRQGSGTTSTSMSALIVGMLLLSLVKPAEVMADVPTEALLESLEQRLLAPKECLPHCAAISQGVIIVDDDWVTLDFLIDATESVVVPLPVDNGVWKPTSISVNAKTVAATQRQGATLVLLTKGRNRVVVKGRHHQVERLNFSFKLSPHNIKISAKGWEVVGYVNGRLASGNLQLTRKQPVEKKAERQQLLADPAPAFVEVTRTLRLGLEWRVTTQVRRMAPARGAISIAIPLLKNESLTTDLPIKDNKVLVSLGVNQSQLVWESLMVLSPGNSAEAVTSQKNVVLTAVSGNWVERWNVIPSQRWHVAFEGLLPIKQAGINQVSWWPVAEDSVALTITKPVAVEGSSLTLQSVDLLIEPGTRATQSTLSLAMRSSFAGEYVLDLPADVEVQSVTVDGQSQVRSESLGRVVIPVKPGEHQAEVRWSTADGARVKIVTPAIALGQPASNVSIRVRMPQDRWTLFVGGPAMGPALLFWGVALVIIAASLLLGRVQWSVLKSYEWALLGLGVATTFVPMLLVIVGWFYLFYSRQQWAMSGGNTTPRKLMAMQWGLGLLTLAMLLSLFMSVASSLIFGNPEMQIVGNGSNAYWLNWYQDRTEDVIPTGWVISLPMNVYRLAMLAWSMWLAFALIRWLRWGWQCFTQPIISNDEEVDNHDNGG